MTDIPAGMVAYCPACEGEGAVEHPFLTNYASLHAESPADPVMIECEDCGGTGKEQPHDD